MNDNQQPNRIPDDGGNGSRQGEGRSPQPQGESGGTKGNPTPQQGGGTGAPNGSPRGGSPHVGGGNNAPHNNPIAMFVIFSLVALLATNYMYNTFGNSSGNPSEMDYSTFIELVKDDQVDEVEIEARKINITLKKDADYKPDTSSSGTSGEKSSSASEDAANVPGTDETSASESASSSSAVFSAGSSDKREYFTYYIEDDNLLPTLEEHHVTIKVAKEDNTAAIIYNLISFILPVALLIGFYAYLMRRSGGSNPFTAGRSNAKVYVEKSTGVTFADVAGQDEAKESLQEVVDFLHNPKKYTEIGAKLPKGALLVGPPGTGKTLLAKAVAGEAGVPFFSLAGSDFVEMFVGVGASRVRDLFKDAYKAAPCIIFIDEIDAIGKSRDSRYGGGNDEREQTLNQLLAEMDGFDTTKGLLILAATNRPEVLDKALLRPGRFDRRIIVDRPDLKGRLETLKVHSKDVAMDETVDLDAMALASAGLVGSDLANIINEAAIIAVKNDRKYVNQDDLFEAFELVAVGGKEKKDRVMSDKERHIVSYHEVGHALVSALQKNTEPVQKITIVPRTMGALGYTLQTPEEEKYLETKDELLAKITVFMGGRAAENLVYGSSTSGAANDIEKATAIARNMVTRFGMSERFGMMGLATVESQYLEGRAALTCGEKTASRIDGEVLAIINGCYDKAYSLLEEHREVLDEISTYLYRNETITGKEFMDLFRDLTGIEAEEDDDKRFVDEEIFEDEEAPEFTTGRRVDLVAED